MDEYDLSIKLQVTTTQDKMRDKFHKEWPWATGSVSREW